MCFKKKHFFRFLFIFYFLFYAISPLCYSIALNETAVIKGEINHDFKKIRLFLWDLIYSTVLQREAPEDNSSNVCLIKKARAILGSDTTTKITREYSASSENTFILPETQLYITFVLIPNSPFGGFYPLFSGLSPPSV